eukprot:scaffold29154_cov53-Attheya_sp.AAC.2
MGNSGINVVDSVESRIHMAGTGMILIGCQEGVDGSKLGASASCQPVEHTNGRTIFLLKTLSILGRHVDIGNTIDGKARPIWGSTTGLVSSSELVLVNKELGEGCLIEMH